MSTDYRTYKETLHFSKILEIEKSLEGFTVVISENPQDVWGIRYQGNFLVIFLSDDRQTVELLTRYGLNKVGKILSIITHFTGVTLYDEHEYMEIIDREIAETILIVHFTHEEKALGLDFAECLQKKALCINVSPFDGQVAGLLKSLSKHYVSNLWFATADQMGGKEALVREIYNSWENDIDNLVIYIGGESIDITDQNL